MDGSLPTSLKHIISNAEYYGPSLFLLGKPTEDGTFGLANVKLIPSGQLCVYQTSRLHHLT